MIPINLNSKDKWIAAGLLAFVCTTIVIAFVVLASRYKVNTSSLSVSRAASLTPTPTQIMLENVMITNNGFVPSQITINTGGQVSILNFADSVVQVVSDDPSKPEMNLGTIAIGETKVVTFTNSGTYSYHNAGRIEQKGMIIVK